MTTATIPNFGSVQIIGFVYEGYFSAEFQRTDEDVTFTGDGRHCIVRSPRGTTRIKPGDFVSRKEDGSLFVASSQPPQDFSTASGEESRGTSADPSCAPLPCGLEDSVHARGESR